MATNALDSARPLLFLCVPPDFAPGLADAFVVGCGVALGPGEADPVGTGSGATLPTASTWRKNICAVEPICLSTALRPLPGTETTMLWPSILTSDSPTPAPSMRERMISTAVSRFVFVMLPLFPDVSFGSRVTSVPPRRSRPSCGFVWPVANMIA